jgi:hypothetical protein
MDTRLLSQNQPNFIYSVLTWLVDSPGNCLVIDVTLQRGDEVHGKGRQFDLFGV